MLPRLLAALAATVLSSAALAATLSPVAAGKAYHSETTNLVYDSAGHGSYVTISTDSVTGVEPTSPLLLDAWPNYTHLPYGYFEDRAWVAFLIPDLADQVASAVALSVKNNLPGAAPLSVNEVSSTLPGTGESLTGNAAASIFADVGDGSFGTGQVPRYGEATIWMTGPILTQVMAHEGALLYLGLSVETIQIPLLLSDVKLHISTISAVPLPSAAWLFGPAVVGLLAMTRFRRAANR